MLSMFRNLVKNEEGATAIEYGLIAALISVAAVAAFSLVGSHLGTMMNNVAGKM